MFYCMFYFTCDRSLNTLRKRPPNIDPPKYFDVTERWTDRQTDNLPWKYRSMRSIVR